MHSKVTYGNNVDRQSEIVDENTSMRDFLESHGVDYSRGSMHLDGSTLGPGALDKTFKEMGITKSCFLLNVVKAD